MATGVRLYNEYLFGGCYKSTIVKKFNNAPGSAVGGGIDADVAARIGFKSMETLKPVPGANKGWMQGICCGITAGWMVAFLGGNSAATDHDEFTSYFMGPLRFQGGYVKDVRPNASSIKLLLEGFGLKSSKKTKVSERMAPEDIASHLPLEEEGTWAAYISAYHHAIGISYRNYRYFVMEPNGGLFEYSNKKNFVTDLGAFLTARRNKKAPGSNPAMKVHFYKA